MIGLQESVRNPTPISPKKNRKFHKNPAIAPWSLSLNPHPGPLPEAEGEISIRNPDSQPRLGVGPIRIGGGLGNSQSIGGLADRQAGKVAKLDEFGFA